MESVTAIYEPFTVYHTSAWSSFEAGRNGNTTCAEARFTYRIYQSEASSEENPSFSGHKYNKYKHSGLRYKVLLCSLSTTDCCCFEED